MKIITHHIPQTISVHLSTPQSTDKTPIWHTHALPDMSTPCIQIYPTLRPVNAETEARGLRPARYAGPTLYTTIVATVTISIWARGVWAGDGAQRSVLGVHGWDGVGHVRHGRMDTGTCMD
ncbi:hypothetical protein SCLCIDRAFT_1216372 [Scleroderma citrinum Foug A]|uniref:Uncharacterized protein n=1 Tax=Scleroderma citrinum Foug A TaxID=1036808 RepID=A0A0C3DY31_9AGAM|nr:hypothetical protein SCLCIDRAFT_1216372 [Scleroderma citrinum Foug A]